MTRVALAAAAIAGVLGVVAVVLIARSRAAAPLRCPSGLIALGPRCCGEGQTLGEGARCEGAAVACSPPLAPSPKGCIVVERVVAFIGGELHVGPGDWDAQGKVLPRVVRAAPFRLDAFETTEAAWSRCVAASECLAVPLHGEPARAVVGVTFGEARRFCQAKLGDVPTVDQMLFAAGGSRARRYPWGDTGAVCRRAAWGLAKGPCAEGANGPELVGSHPDGASPEGVFDLAGNVAEWTVPEPADGPSAKVTGGSWADGEASALRTWSSRDVLVTTRSPEIGFRCAYPAAEPR